MKTSRFQVHGVGVVGGEEVGVELRGGAVAREDEPLRLEVASGALNIHIEYSVNNV